eukprot:CAMPEP_0178757758 /NCGR_PEP_ID=MMETSP0744-20121128/13991_1 /TAXON_ID=913974 /ORGANISM="Nitzschia punctata, Strain CCMP561" /LENGTH=293 /DNA_ID=CAMNT_0020412013 /DNA_START=226 /DNA_END=1107 /DNA_ORIENTATION=-
MVGKASVESQCNNTNAKIGIINDGDDDLDSCIHKLRIEIETMRREREANLKRRQVELEQRQSQFRAAQQRLHHKLLSERTNQTLYMQFLKHDYPQQGKEQNGVPTQAAPSSMYILQQETPLLSAMHRTFSVLPKQISLTEQYYQEHLYPYLQQELKKVQLDHMQVSERLVEQVSEVAQDNHALYGDYQEQVTKQEQELRHWKQLLPRRTTKHKHHDQECDELLSATEHSLTEHSEDYGDEDDASNHGDDEDFTIGFLTATTKLLLTPTEMLQNSIGNMKHMVHSEKFQLPFGH